MICASVARLGCLYFSRYSFLAPSQNFCLTGVMSRRGILLSGIGFSPLAVFGPAPCQRGVLALEKQFHCRYVGRTNAFNVQHALGRDELDDNFIQATLDAGDLAIQWHVVATHDASYGAHHHHFRSSFSETTNSATPTRMSISNRRYNQSGISFMSVTLRGKRGKGTADATNRSALTPAAMPHTFVRHLRICGGAQAGES